MMDTREFAHLTYGEIIKQFGLNTTHTFSSWDRLPDAEREKWMSALAVIHAQVFPHGDVHYTRPVNPDSVNKPQ